ncbi:hypothetical protein [Sphingobium yanoikuyae]|uniref:Uncharacterized protein n=2 Tax=Sphingobium TaxID=165695 RepID=A0A430BQB4_SPHYA|nr:hypothetical protein [Sphingobium yanoikuyae]RSU54928.1 hypothetical protein DAH51_19115 [Sphingobium yanoikuyae]
MSANEEQIGPEQSPQPLRLGDWLWRPLCAKLWWAAVPLYWLGMWASHYSQAAEDLYGSALAGYLTVFFFPPLVALILSYGFFREWLARLLPSEAAPLSSEDWFPDPDGYGPSGMPWEFDPLDPRSGALWVGNTLNPLNAGYINRAS